MRAEMFTSVAHKKKLSNKELTLSLGFNFLFTNNNEVAY